jgi:hypothetical protein
MQFPKAMYGTSLRSMAIFRRSRRKIGYFISRQRLRAGGNSGNREENSLDLDSGACATYNFPNRSYSSQYDGLFFLLNPLKKLYTSDYKYQLVGVI